VKSGVFNANIGDGGTLDYNFQDNDTVYLNIEVANSSGGSCAGINGTTFQTLSPRQRIISSAYTINASTVSGIGQSMLGTTTPVSIAVATIEATTTSAVPLAIRGFLNQVSDLFRVVTNTGTQLLTFTADGNLGIGSSTPYARLSVGGQVVADYFTATTTSISTFPEAILSLTIFSGR